MDVFGWLILVYVHVSIYDCVCACVIGERVKMMGGGI